MRLWSGCCTTWSHGPPGTSTRAGSRAEQRLAETAGALDPEGDSHSLQMAVAVATYLSFRRDEVDEDAEELVRLAASAVFNGNPPAAVATWLEEQGVG
jgi:hypothetical protein